MEALTRDTEKQLEAVASAERTAFDNRLHDLAQQYAHRPAGINPHCRRLQSRTNPRRRACPLACRR
ncbi:hypothetical protein AXE65_04505 [Ventosimonas gracilis]|uniref:Uncharacterized protein n=1 Tax=Ventosimonas gracilis TaxID=1680762 RepID=A0A139SQU7_9GAMM|nr:hypothetical protein AXE65_04505 [Ventosimonas gracilis]